jgi:hypothetical protein
MIPAVLSDLRVTPRHPQGPDGSAGLMGAGLHSQQKAATLKRHQQ